MEDGVRRVAIVTGAAQGIGQAIALRLARDGLGVCVADRKPSGAETAEKIRSAGGQAVFVRTDVTDPESVRGMVDEARARLHRIDVLVNNAGISNIMPFLEITIEEWNRLVGVILTGTFLCCRAVLPFLLEQGWGRVINISSTSGITGGTSGAHYAAAKGAVISFTKALSREVAPGGVTVNAVAPSKIETAQMRFKDQQEREELLKRIPVRRLGRPDDIAALVSFLASEESGHITGDVIVASGGYL